MSDDHITLDAGGAPAWMEQILERTMKHEGGFVDDPDDAGGTTNWGISLRFLRSLSLEEGDLDHDGDIDGDDIRQMTRAQAAKFYLDKIAAPLRLGEIQSNRLRWKLFDMAVNMGQRQAVKLLQEVVSVEADGILGDQTLAALETRFFALEDVADWRIAEQLILFNLARAQALFYRRISSRGNNLKFLPGWIFRAMDTADDMA